MKKRFIYAMITAMAMTTILAGCGSKKAEEAPAAAEAEAPAEEAPAEVEAEVEEEPEDWPDNFLEERTGQFVYDSAEDVVAALEDGEAYSYVKVMGSDDDVLMIAQETFGGYDAPAALECHMYTQNEDGKWDCKGVMFSGTTACPIATDADGRIYAAAHDTIDVMALDKNNGALMNIAYLYVERNEDESKNVYGGFVRSENNVEEDAPSIEGEEAAAAFDKAFADMEAATPIAFTIVGGEQAGYVTYEFETFDGQKVVIDDSNIVSQEAVENALETDIVPADAEEVAPGRDYVYLADAEHYYVEDAVNGLVTTANK